MADGRLGWWARQHASLLVQLAANVVPFVGVLVVGWELGHVMLLFWAENIVLGVYHVVRLGARTLGGASLFLVHYGLFTAAHGLLVIGLFVQTPTFTEVAPGHIRSQSEGPWIPTLVAVSPAIGALFVSHGFAAVASFRARRGPDAPTQTGLLYARVVALHLALMATGFIALRAGSPLWSIVILLGLKALADVGGYLLGLRERGGLPG